MAGLRARAASPELLRRPAGSRRRPLGERTCLRRAKWKTEARGKIPARGSVDLGFEGQSDPLQVSLLARGSRRRRSYSLHHPIPPPSHPFRDSGTRSFLHQGFVPLTATSSLPDYTEFLVMLLVYLSANRPLPISMGRHFWTGPRCNVDIQSGDVQNQLGRVDKWRVPEFSFGDTLNRIIYFGRKPMQNQIKQK